MKQLNSNNQNQNCINCSSPLYMPLPAPPQNSLDILVLYLDTCVGTNDLTIWLYVWVDKVSVKYNAQSSAKYGLFLEKVRRLSLRYIFEVQNIFCATAALS